MTTTETTTTPDDERSDGTIAVLPPSRPVDMAAISTLREHVGAMREAKFFAEGMCFTQMVPERFRGKVGDGAAAILFGAELGLSPIASLRSVIVIHGSAGLEARTMKALLKAKGYHFRTIERTATVHEIWAWEPDSPKVYDDDGYRINPDETSRWTFEDCVQEGWVPKPSSLKSLKRPDVKEDWVTVNRNGKVSVVGNIKYITSPRTMLKAKATAEVCRDIAPHILLGMPYSSEELESFDDDVIDMAPRREAKAGRGVSGLRDRAQQARKAQENVVDAEVIPDQEPEPLVDGDTVDEQDLTSSPDHPARKKWSNAMFKLFGAVGLSGDVKRDDRITVTRALVERDDITSSNDLTDRELVKLVRDMESFGDNLGDEVGEILNLADLSAENAAQQDSDDSARS